jgi:4-hydroxythreonine-4-phosphate dehydrogenase
MGDPAGIGPEVALRAASRARRDAEIVWVGDAGVLAETARNLGLPAPRRVDEVSALAAKDRRPGRPTREGAAAAYAAILRGVELVAAGEAAGIVTAPVSKKAIQDLVHDFPGHTETIAALAGGAEVRMMMWGPRLRVVLVTTHVPYASVPAALSVERVVRTAEIAAEALHRRFGIRRPRLALAGLNPHAGEGGAFGDDEIRVLAPAVARATKGGLRLSGPHPCDQGLAPFKVLHFRDGVNVTLGLPFPRTSPDHGTAFAIAGKGRADAASMTAALRLAARMSS